MNLTQKREEYAIVLDFLPNGHPNDTRPSHKKTAIVLAIGKSKFALLELVPKRGIFLQPNKEVYIGDGKREEIHHIVSKIEIDRLTSSARKELEYVVKELIKQNEATFVEFFNKARPLSTRMHMLELLPGVGKKHMWEIIDARDMQPFTSFNDIKARVKLIPVPETLIAKRIMQELKGGEKHNIFVDK